MKWGKKIIQYVVLKGVNKRERSPKRSNKKTRLAGTVGGARPTEARVDERRCQKHRHVLGLNK